MWIKIKDILLNLSNFHTIGKRKFEIKFSYSQEVFVLHRMNVIENLKELKKYCWRENRCNIEK